MSLYTILNIIENNMKILQSYCSCTLCKRENKGESQLKISVVAPSILPEHIESRFEDTLRLNIILKPIYCDGWSCLWHQRLLLTSHISYDVINPCLWWRKHHHTIEITKEFAESWNVIILSISLLSLHILSSEFISEENFLMKANSDRFDQ